MNMSSLVCRGLAICVLLFVFGMSVYRAKVLPVAHDEALTYEWFLDQGVYHVLNYNTTNHVLQTLMAKPVVKFFGATEFNLRIPSVIGAGIYLLAAYFLCRRLFGDGVAFLLAVGLLTLNPEVMDFMVAARGFGLGLAGLAVAMFFFAKLEARGKFDGESKEWRWGCGIASVSLALAVAASLTEIVPAVCLAALFAIVTLGGSVLRFKDRTFHDFARYFVFPGAAVGFCILWPYVIQFRPAQTNVNFHSGTAAVHDTFTATFLYKWTEDLATGLNAVAPAAGSWQAKVTDAGEYVLLPLLFCFVLIGLVLALRTPAEAASHQARCCTIFAGAAIASVVLIVALHLAFKIDYPFSRYCLFLIPLFTVGGILAAQEISSRFPSISLKGAGLLIAAVVLADYVLSLNTGMFRYNAYDHISRDVYHAIERDARSRGLKEARVGGTWWYEPEVNFYRLSTHASWMLPYDIKDPSTSWQTPNSLAPGDYDYFLYTPANDPALSGSRVKTIFRDDKTQLTIIAIAK